MKKVQNTSIVDIARELGVAKSTISSVLNGKTEERRISAETKKRILDYIKISGFRPNSVARSLRTGRSKIIGMLVEDISNPFFAEVAHLVEQKFAREGYRILLSSTENDSANTAEALATFQERQVDGYIIAPPSGLPVATLNQILGKKPLVIFDRSVGILNAVTVQVDNYNSMAVATRHLIENNYSNIAFITIESEQLQMLDRQKGYEGVLHNYGMKGIIAKIDWRLSNDEIKDTIQDFIVNNPIIDAVIFSTNYIALPGLKALKALHITVPDKMGVIGFDDIPYYELMNPTITSVVQPTVKIANRMVKLLLTQLRNNQLEPMETSRVQLQGKLIKRESTASHHL